MALESIRYADGQLAILDQLLLPAQNKYISVKGVEDGWKVINRMQVRGAPAIAIVGCLSLAVEIGGEQFVDKKSLRQEIEGKLNYLVSARPTAVNVSKTCMIFTLCIHVITAAATPNTNTGLCLRNNNKQTDIRTNNSCLFIRPKWISIFFCFFSQMKIAADELIKLANELSIDDKVAVDEMKQKFIDTTEAMLLKDIQDNKAIGTNGANSILANTESSVRVLTHCNTGSLATAGYGTALGVVRKLHELNRLEHVYCTETRPYNQGARLTAFELVHDKLPATLIIDSMVAALLRSKVSLFIPFRIEFVKLIK